MICSYEHNICGLSCLRTEAERKKELEQLYNGERPKFNCARYVERSKRSILTRNKTTIFADTKNGKEIIFGP